MIRSGKASKDNSPLPSRASSLRGDSAREAKRTVLKLENDDWSDDETISADGGGPESAGLPRAGGTTLEPADMAAVAQMMKSTVRKRSPRGVFGLFSFSRNKKHASLRSGSDHRLQDAFSPPSRNDLVYDSQQQLSNSQPTLSPSTSSSNVSALKGSPHRKKKGSFLRPSGSASLSNQLAHSVDDIQSQPSQSSPSLGSKGHRRTSSSADNQARAISPAHEKDLNSILARQSAANASRSDFLSSQRRSLSKKELKELEKREKKAKKEAKKEAKRQTKGSKKEKSMKISVNHSGDIMQHRYTSEMTTLPQGFDPSALKASLTPLRSSQRMGSPSRARPASNGESPSNTGTIRVDLQTGEMATVTTPDGSVHETLVRALSSESWSSSSTKDKRQSFVSLQLLASGLDGLDLGGIPEEYDLDGLVASLDGHGLARSASIGPPDLASEASSLYSDPSSLGLNDISSDDSDTDEDDDSVSSTSSSDMGSDTDTGSVASSVISTSWAMSIPASIDEAEVELNKRALQSGIQVELIKKIGKGAYGTVWYGLLDGRPVAVKQVELREVSGKRSLEVRNAIKREVQLVQNLNCVHIVRYFGMFASKAQQLVTLIMELVPGVSVTAFVLDRICLSERLAAFIVHQVLLGLKYLEERKIIHRDVKPDNLLMTSRGVVKMIDFGTAASLENQNARKSTVGTPWYCAPEVIRSEDYSHPADIWSLGCTLIELLSGKPPYDDLTDVACLFKMAEGNTPPLPEKVGADCESFLKACLAPLPNDRLSASALLQHPWITEIMKDADAIAEEITRAMDLIIVPDLSAKRPA